MDFDELIIQKIAILLGEARMKYAKKVADIKIQVYNEYENDPEKAEDIWERGVAEFNELLDGFKE